MSTHGINAIGVLVGNPDEIVFVLTKGDVERVYNMENNVDLGTPLPESVWSPSRTTCTDWMIGWTTLLRWRIFSTTTVEFL
jgi:hypothetical protein